MLLETEKSNLGNRQLHSMEQAWIGKEKEKQLLPTVHLNNLALSKAKH